MIGTGLWTDEKVLDGIVSRVVDAVQPDKILLFGSLAKGEGRSDSDVDLLVIKSDVTHRRSTAQKAYRALRGVGVPVDVIVVTPKDVEQYKDKVGSIIAPALAEGRVLYDAGK